MLKRWQIFFILGMGSLMLALEGCSFHLRGYASLPPALQRLYVNTATPYSNFNRQLTRHLKQIGVQVVSFPQQAFTVLDILSEKNSSTEDNASLDGQVKNYTLNSSVTYQLKDTHGQVLDDAHTVSTFRNYLSQINNVLGATHEQEALEKEMQRDLVNQLIIQLGSRSTQQRLHNFKLPSIHETAS